MVALLRLPRQRRNAGSSTARRSCHLGTRQISPRFSGLHRGYAARVGWCDHGEDCTRDATPQRGALEYPLRLLCAPPRLGDAQTSSSASRLLRSDSSIRRSRLEPAKGWGSPYSTASSSSTSFCASSILIRRPISFGPIVPVTSSLALVSRPSERRIHSVSPAKVGFSCLGASSSPIGNIGVWDLPAGARCSTITWSIGIPVSFPSTATYWPSALTSRTRVGFSN